MTIEVKQTHTSTGVKAAIDVGPPKTLSFFTVGDVDDYTADVEVLLTEGGTWVAAEASILDSAVKTTTGPVFGVRLNITALGTATTIDFEVLGERQ